MTLWKEGDIAVAKKDTEYPHFPVLTITKGKMYRVLTVGTSPNGTLCLDIGSRVQLPYHEEPSTPMWPHYFFEKLVAGDTDIFKLADAPKVTEDA